MSELLLPRTDGGALAQLLVAVVVFGTALVLVRRSADLRWFAPANNSRGEARRAS